MANFITAHDQQNDHSMGVHGIVKTQKKREASAPLRKLATTKTQWESFAWVAMFASKNASPYLC